MTDPIKTMNPQKPAWDMSTFVHVYGTLRKTGSNSHLMASAEFIGVSRISGYDMFSLGRYPFIYPADEKSGDSSITIETYRVDEGTLELLDRLEGYFGPGNPQNFYERVEAECENGRRGLLYVLSESCLKSVENKAKPVSPGDWIGFKSAITKTEF